MYITIIIIITAEIDRLHSIMIVVINGDMSMRLVNGDWVMCGSCMGLTGVKMYLHQYTYIYIYTHIYTHRDNNHIKAIQLSIIYLPSLAMISMINFDDSPVSSDSRYTALRDSRYVARIRGATKR